MSCQQRSMEKGFLPISRPAHCSSMSRQPPSPTPVSLGLDVSTVTTMLLWLKVWLSVGGAKMRTRVMVSFGRSAAATGGTPVRAAAALATTDLRAVLRSTARLPWLGVRERGKPASVLRRAGPAGHRGATKKVNTPGRLGLLHG